MFPDYLINEESHKEVFIAIPYHGLREIKFIIATSIKIKPNYFRFYIINYEIHENHFSCKMYGTVNVDEFICLVSCFPLLSRSSGNIGEFPLMLAWHFFYSL